METKGIKILLCYLLTFAVALTGCSAGNTQVAGSNQNDGTTSIKDTLNFGVIAEPSTLDPKNTNEMLSNIFLQQIYDTLIREDSNGVLQPQLAEKWETSKDGMEMTLTIRQGVKFHNGDTMTADDVVYSLNQAINSSYTAKFTGHMDKAEKIDDKTVLLKLKYPYAPTASCLSIASMSIVSQKAVEANPDGFGRNPVGTGPYKFVEWKTGESVILQRFDDYYQGQPRIKNLTFKILTDTSTAIIALEKGEIDALDSSPKSDKQNLVNNPDLNYYESDASHYYHITMNNQKGVFSDERVRLAVSYAINRDELVLGGLDGLGVPVECPVPPSSFGYQPDFKNNPYDPERAKDLLAEAGYPNGLKVEMKTVESPTYSKPSEILQEQLRKVGIDAEISIMERGAYLQDVYTDCNYDITVWMITDMIGDADYGTYSRLHSSMWGGGNNLSQCSIPELDKLLSDARISTDNDERMKLYGEISAIVRDKAPLIPIMTGKNNIVASKNLKGVYPQATLKYYVYDYYWE